MLVDRADGLTMPDLIAQGTDSQHRWRRALQEGQVYVIGRQTGSWETPWDPHISRRHVEVCWRDDVLHVRLLPEAKNPVFFRGRAQSEFSLRPGEHFVIGSTTFTLSVSRAAVSLTVPAPMTQQVFSPEALRRARFHQADQRIEVLSRLPDVIAGADNDSELFVRLVNLLLAGIPDAAAVALVACETDEPQSPIRVLHWDRRIISSDDFRPSERLIREALQRGQSVVHVWAEPAPTSASTYTQSEGTDWAFCTPVRGEECHGWAIYVAGQRPADARRAESSDPSGLRDDVKFTELAATTLSHLRKLRQLERRQAGLRAFFSPVVLDALAGQDPQTALAPREVDVTVLFCDLRGFSQHAERQAQDLFGLLRRVSRALGLVTHRILEESGVVGDFHGDAAMGFWGWPLDQTDAAVRACRAAIRIRRDFLAARLEDAQLADFRVGIGIATGRAVAGSIGTVDQVKVTAFGPVVNLAARLESMTRILQGEILLDETTAAQLRNSLVPHEARLRRVATVLPYGLANPLSVYELLPPTGPDSECPLTDEHLSIYDAALQAFENGQWDTALRLLHQVPAEDRVKDFLTVYIARHNRVPPPQWNGVVALEAK